MTTALTVPTRPRVLFVGHNASSPQIAASLLRRLAGDRVRIDTATTRAGDPGGRSHEPLAAMGLDPADDQRLSARALHTADRVISLGAGLDVARLPGPRYEEWDLAQEDLAVRIQSLSEELTATPAARPRAALLERLRALFGSTRR
jgi:hypothetical protein